MKYDAIILGCGPGGMEAAQLLAGKGKNIAAIDEGTWGGICLNAGCIPTKMLLAATSSKLSFERFKKQKILTGEMDINCQYLQKRVWRNINATKQSIKQMLNSHGIETITARAAIQSPDTIILENSNHEKLNFNKLIIASGSKPAQFPGLEIDHDCILDSTDLLHLEKVPESLCIIGSGAIGIEFATYYNSLGTKVIIVEAAKQIAPNEDDDISEALLNSLIKRGNELHIGVKASKLITDNGKAHLFLENGEEIITEKALLAVGRKGFALENGAVNAGCKVGKNGFISTNNYLQATENIYAIGDCNGKTLLAHAAIHQGAYVARHILKEISVPYESGPIPACVYGDPEIMTVGMNVKKAMSIPDSKIEISVAQLAANPFAQSHCDPYGFIKAIWLNNNLVGISAIGGSVTHLVTAAQLLVANNYSIDKLNEIMFSHPSLDESLAAAIRHDRQLINN